jgi:hypothetical protein
MKTTFRVEEQRNNRNMTEFRWVHVDDFETLEEAKKYVKTTHPWRAVTETDPAYESGKNVVATAICAFTENEHRIIEVKTATNYHIEAAEFRINQTVTHVTDEGAMVKGRVTDIENGLLHVEFEDGESGWEKPETCF